MTIYKCDHIQFVEMEFCPYYDEKQDACVASELKRSWHFPKFDCRACRSEKAKLARYKYRSENKARFKHEV
jgi:hypothetical protein